MLSLWLQRKNGKLDEHAKHFDEEKGVDTKIIELNAADEGKWEIVGIFGMGRKQRWRDCVGEKYKWMCLWKCLKDNQW